MTASELRGGAWRVASRATQAVAALVLAVGLASCVPTQSRELQPQADPEKRLATPHMVITYQKTPFEQDPHMKIMVSGLEQDAILLLSIEPVYVDKGLSGIFVPSEGVFVSPGVARVRGYSAAVRVTPGRREFDMTLNRGVLALTAIPDSATPTVPYGRSREWIVHALLLEELSLPRRGRGGGAFPLSNPGQVPTSPVTIVEKGRRAEGGERLPLIQDSGTLGVGFVDSPMYSYYPTNASIDATFFQHK